MFPNTIFKSHRSKKMKRNILVLLFAMVFAFAVSFVGCKKEEVPAPDATMSVEKKDEAAAPAEKAEEAKKDEKAAAKK